MLSDIDKCLILLYNKGIVTNKKTRYCRPEKLPVTGKPEKGLVNQ